MRLVRLKVRNFRCYANEISVDFDDLTAIIGRNDAGKSALLEALAVFFEEAKLDKDDGHEIKLEERTLNGREILVIASND